jgi:hypothetical protein
LPNGLNQFPQEFRESNLVLEINVDFEDPLQRDESDRRGDGLFPRRHSERKHLTLLPAEKARQKERRKKNEKNLSHHGENADKSDILPGDFTYSDEEKRYDSTADLVKEKNRTQTQECKQGWVDPLSFNERELGIEQSVTVLFFGHCSYLDLIIAASSGIMISW